ncbi:MAG: hypothetical protein J1E96_07180 [Ruminococcus sp.]|nr:hypothetical protein [Ruminococcus sp.]
MKENKLFKQVSDRQMPDLEAIRKACIEQQPQEKKSKIIRFSTPRIISVAAVCVLLAIGMIAAFANPGGVFTHKRPEVAVTETEATKASSPKKSKTEKKTSTGSNSHSSTTADVSEKDEQTSEEKLIKRLSKNDINVTTLYELGEVENFSICYATGSNKKYYSCDYIIGDYVFSTTTQCNPYGLGIYAVSKKKCLALDEAYSMEVFDNFDEVAELIENSEMEITVKRDDSDAESIIEYFDTDTISVANVGEIEGGRLLYRTDDYYIGETSTEFFGDYEFFCSDSQETYALGIYFIEDGEVCTLTEAVEQEKITDISKVVELVNELKTKTAVKVFIYENEEPTTEPETEEPTDDIEEE